MDKKFWGVIALLLGSTVVVGSIAIWLVWLAFCFGTVIVGLALLFLAPAVLIAPIVIGGGYGLKLIAIGMEGFD